MDLPFTFPAWLPWWVPFVLLVPALLYGLAFLFMPFSVIGVKGRLEIVEARLDEIQNEIRHLALRLPAAGAQQADFDEVYAPPSAAQRRSTSAVTRPPIPPAPSDLHGSGEYQDQPAPPPTRPVRREPGGHPGRAEPRLDWPR